MTAPVWLTDLLANPVFAGVAGGAGVSALLYQARAIPVALWRLLQRTFTISLEIDNNDELFDRLAIHLSESPHVMRARWLRMVELYDYQMQRWTWRPSFGPGWHLVCDAGDWFLINRSIEEKSGGLTLTRRETITIRSLGRDQTAMRALMERAEKVYERSETIRVHLFNKGAWMLTDRKATRDPATLFLPGKQKERIFADLERFIASRADYRRRGVPYRRGYLFEGPPGTGKTSLALVLAGIARRPLYMINLNTCGGDTGLQLAFNSLDPGAIIAIEDIDTSKISHDRTERSAKINVETLAETVTLGGLLNAIDGLASRDDRVLIMTSNCADKLDEALLRPGRIDRRERIDRLDRPTALDMVRAFLGDDAEAWLSDQHIEMPVSPAVLQGLLLGTNQ